MSGRKRKPKQPDLSDVGANGVPVPLDEKKSPDKKLMHFEGWDYYLPSQKGFISDFVYALRGTKVPTSFAVWCALLALSTIIKREAWLEWYPKRMFTNFYLLLVAPPSICGKDTVINFMREVLMGVTGKLSDCNWRTIKNLRVIQNKGTQQYIADALTARKVVKPLWTPDANGNATSIPLLDEHGKPRTHPMTSEAIIIAPEFSVLMGKEKYNEGLVSFLLDVYNTHEVWETGTKTDGKSELRHLHTTMVGGTTPDAVRDSLPKQVAGDGFLSRTIIAYHSSAARRVPIPKPVRGAPSPDELSHRLAWIAEHTHGGYEMNEEALEFYVKWHGAFMDQLEKYPELVGIQGREDINLQKLSLLMHAQRYAEDRIITLDDVKDAALVLEGTTTNSMAVLGEISGGPIFKKMQTVARFIAKNKKVTRVKVLQACSKRVSAFDLTNIVNDLRERDLVKIMRGKDESNYASSHGEEVYVWTGKETDIP